MARTHMRWQFGAWDKPDHAETGKDARHLYMVICSDETINQAGVVTIRLGLWADEAAMDDDEAASALEELEKRRFIVTDTRYSQLLIRSFIRSDEVYKQPNVLRSALSHARALRSKPIKRVLAEELRKLPPKQADKVLDNGRTFVYPDPHATADEIDPDGPDGGAGQGSLDPSGKPSRNPSGKGSDNPPEVLPDEPRDGLFGEGFPEGFSEGSVEVEVEVEVEVSPVAPHQKQAPTELAPADDHDADADAPSPGSKTASRKRSARENGHRIPDDWWPTDGDRAWFRENCPALVGQGTPLTHEFIGYWRNKPGKDGRKLNWSLAWQTWMRKENRTRTSRPGRKQTSDIVATGLDHVAAMEAQEKEAERLASIHQLTRGA